MPAPVASKLTSAESVLDPDALAAAPLTETYTLAGEYYGMSPEQIATVLLFNHMDIPVFDGKDSPRKAVTWIPGHRFGDGVRGPVTRYKVMAIGKVPGLDELRARRNLVGQSGRLLREIASELDYDINQWYVTNLVRFCPPDGGKTLNKAHIQDSMCLLAQEISIIRPEYIILFGSDAVKAMFGKNATLEKFRANVFFMRGIRALGEAPAALKDIDDYDKAYGIKLFATTAPANVLREVCLRDGFKTDIQAFRRLTEGVEASSDVSKREYIYTSEAAKVREVVDRLLAEDIKELSIDCEWGGEDPYRGRLRTIQFSWAAEKACVVILRNCGGADSQDLYSRQEILRDLKRLFTKKGLRIIGHNFRSDAKWLEHLGLPVVDALWFDTMLADHVLNENAEHGLEACTVRYTNMGRYDWSLTKWLGENKYDKKKMKLNGYMMVPDELLLPYAACDVDATFRIAQVLSQRLDQPDNALLRGLFYDIIMPTNLPIHEIEMTGLMIDRDRMTELVWKYNAKKVELERDLKAVTNNPDFNPRSYIQIKELLFKTLKLKPFKTTEKPSRMWEDIENLPIEVLSKLNPSTDSETLEAIAGDDPTGTVPLLRDFKIIDQVTKNFLRLPDSKEYGDDEFSEGLVGKIDDDGRLRTSLSQMSETGRHKSYDPNLQNLPKKQDAELMRIMGKDIHKIRSCFIAPDGHVIIEADYDSAEIYTLGYLSNCEKLIKDAGGDLHARGAVTAMGAPKWPGFEDFKKPPDDWKKEFENLRIARKTINFGIPYQRGAKAIAREITEATKGNMHCTQSDAQGMIDGYYNDYPEVKQYVEMCKNSVLRPGYISNAFGRRRRFYLNPSDDRSFIAGSQREAVNMPIQGTVAEAINIALYNLYMWRYSFPGRAKYRILLAIHDAVLLEVPFADVETVVDEVLPVCMTYGAEIPSWRHANIWGPTKKFNLKIATEVGLRWGAKPKADEFKAAGVPERLIERFVHA